MVKTDANGCMEAGCNDSLIWLSATEAAEGVWVGRAAEPLLVYSIPATTHLSVKCQIPAAVLPYGGAVWRLYNALGRQVAEETLQGNEGVAEVLVAHLPAGVYYFRVLTPQGQVVASGKVVFE